MTLLDTAATFRFGRFTLEPSRRSLTADGARLALSSRAFDILVLLAENRDRVVGRDEIIARVWRGVAVEDNNLAVQMSALRRALGERADDAQIITTVPGRGYRFVAPLAPDAPAREAEPSEHAPEPGATPGVPAPAPAVAQPPRWERARLRTAAAAALLALPVLAWLLLPRRRRRRRRGCRWWCCRSAT